jgi:hypothetical protein
MNNRHKLGVYQVNKYWVFLLAGYREDVDQIIELTIHECLDKTLKEFSLALNRNLYRLAVDMGFKKYHMNYKPPNSNWWYKPEITKQFVVGMY